MTVLGAVSVQVVSSLPSTAGVSWFSFASSEMRCQASGSKPVMVPEATTVSSLRSSQPPEGDRRSE
jgi:hypothetical protein